ncbi:transposase [Rhizobium leguminosarum]|nr:hypothetical protein CHR56_06940 [Rhizobium leguminosarum bv. viciae]NKJ84371.1 transposase [Rhizobium leguminosarum bv. viciae]NKK18303.1 transposase [Rhizobium leguminosarum bv. viciae]NKK32793.1 transposase [Rhizobium leguminosarum bv. viciae]NKK39466.1 transposase [Rhizobium leguminosarum bv. viciae]
MNRHYHARHPKSRGPARMDTVLMPEHGLICSISKNRLPDAHERLEGPPRQFRRHWSDDFKARAVAQAMEPGASVSAIVHRIGIHPSQLFVL